MDADGDFVVAWASYGQDGDAWGVFAQRFDAAGTPLGLEFRVSTTTEAHQTAPSVAMDSDGDFVVVWKDDYASVAGRLYDDAAAPLGTECSLGLPARCPAS